MPNLSIPEADAGERPSPFLADGGPTAGRRDVRVADVMHPGVVFCVPQASLRTVAQIMARRRIHAVVVMAQRGEMHLIAVEGDPPRAVGVVSTLDLAGVMAEARA